MEDRTQEYVLLGNYRLNQSSSPRLSNPSFQVPSVGLGSGLNGNSSSPLASPRLLYSEPFMMNGNEQNTTLTERRIYVGDNYAILNTPVLDRGLKLEGRYSLRSLRGSDHDSSRNIGSEAEYWKNKYFEMEKKYEEVKASEDKIPIILRNNEELNRVANQRLNEIEELNGKIRKLEALDRDNFEHVSRIRELESRNRELYVELENVRIQRDRELQTREMENERKKLTHLIDSQNKQITEWKFKEETGVSSFKFNRLLEAFLLLGIEVDRLHAILKGRLQETRFWKDKNKSADEKIQEYEKIMKMMKDEIVQLRR